MKLAQTCRPHHKNVQQFLICGWVCSNNFFANCVCILPSLITQMLMWFSVALFHSTQVSPTSLWEGEGRSSGRSPTGIHTLVWLLVVTSVLQQIFGSQTTLSSGWTESVCLVHLVWRFCQSSPSTDNFDLSR